MNRALLAVLAFGLTACGSSDTEAPGSEPVTAGGETASNQNAPPPPAYRPPDSAAHAVGPSPARGRGSSPEDPLIACGPVDSYRRIAEYRCPDGSQPLGGDPGAGQQARLGNVGANSTGHIIDHYQVPCASGAVDIFVDMYGCPEMQGLLGR